MTLRPYTLSATLLAVVLAGCANLPGHKDELAREMAATQAVPVQLPKPTTDDEAPIKINKDDAAHTAAKAEVEPGSSSFINEDAARKAAAGTINEEGQITLNYENMPIQGVVQNILGALLKENYTIAPTVTGNVTFSTAKPITPAQAMPILQMLLGWTNNALVVKEGRYEVVPVKDALPGNLTPRMAPPALAKGYEVRVFPLKYIAPEEMQKLLKPYAKTESFVSYDNARNFIVMAGTASELANYQHTIEVFDVDWLKGMSVGVYGLRNSDVAKIMPDLDKIFGASGESPLAGMFRFIPMETTNSVVVITPQPEYLKQAETWLYRLDAGVGENGTQLYVYDVKNVKAVDLSDHLNAIYTGQVSQRPKNTGNVAPGMKAVGIGQFNAGGGAAGARNNSRNNNNRTQQQAGGATGTNTNLSTTGTGAAALAGGKQETDIRITPIEENNQLLVMATPGEWDSILAAIHRLDVSPLQVQIEAKILEVLLDGDLQYGVQWWLSGLINNGAASGTGIKYGPGFGGNAGDRHRASLGGNSTPTPSPAGGPGLFWGFLNHNFQVAIDALQTNGTTRILSTPSLVVLNNQQAQITVGTQVPVISTSIVGINGVNGVNNNQSAGDITNTGIGQASYISTGVTLDITPRVNPGGLVYMDVDQEDSAAGNPVGTNPNPPINQRNLKTQVAVQSGETVLLGGMIQDRSTDTKSGVPLLSSIPLVGGLFGSTDKNRSRTELIVLITPRVITNPEEAREMTQEYQQKFESLKPLRAANPAALSPVAQPIAPQPEPTSNPSQQP